MFLAVIEASHIIFFLVGLAAVCWGADVFVAGASRLAVLMKISPMLVAVTVVAFASSAPELFVSMEATLSAGNVAKDQAMGNIIGSNICNIALVIGICAMINPFKMDLKFISKEMIFFVLSVLLLYVFLIDRVVSRPEGMFLFFLLLMFFVFCIREVKKGKKGKHSELEFVEGGVDLETKGAEKMGRKKWLKPASYLVVGLFALILGSKLLVTNGEIIGKTFGFSDRLIGLFVFALGTSLPELAISVTAALKKEEEIALGNIIGSNIFNVFCVGGLVSSVSPIDVSEPVVALHLPAMMLVSFALIVFLRIGHQISRLEGGLLVIGYLYYCYLSIWVWSLA